MSKKSKKKKEAAPAAAPVGELPAPRGLVQAAIAVAILLVALWILYPELIFQNKVFSAGDTEAATSFATPIQEAMKKGESYPLWNPYLYSGMPSYESLSFTPYVYPVSLITGFMSRVLAFPNLHWLLFHVFALGFGVYLLMRHLGAHFIVAAVAGVLMMWMPNHVAVGAHGHGSQACAVAYIPYALLFWDRLWRGKGVMLNASALLIVLGFQFLRGHLQITYYTLALIGLHAVFFSASRIADGLRGRDWKTPVFGRLAARMSPQRAALTDGVGSLVVLGLVVAGAMMMSAVLFLPVQDFAPHSIRGASESGGLEYDYATSWSLHPAEMMTFVVPSAFGYGKNTYFGRMPFTDYPNYLGIITVLFAIFAVVLARDRFVIFLLVTIAVTTFVSFGRHLPLLYDPLFNYLPYFNKFRVPVMVLIVQQFAVVLLFGIGLTAVMKADAAKLKRVATIGMIASGIAVVLFLVSYSYWTGGFASSIAPKLRFVRNVQEQVALARDAGMNLFQDLVRVSLFLLAAFALLRLRFKGTLAAVPVVALLACIAALDLYTVDRGVLHPEGRFKNPGLQIIHDKTTRDRFLVADEPIDFLSRDDGFYRVFPMTQPSRALEGEFRSNRYMNFGVASIGGYLPARLSIYEQFLGVLGPSLQYGFDLVNMLNVRYVISGASLGESTLLQPRWQGRNYRGEQQFIYENTQALERVYFVDAYEVLEPAALLQRLGSPNPGLSERVLLESAPAVEPQSAQGAEATITSYGLGEIRIDTKLVAPAVMVLSEIFYPRWQAFVDGEPTEILKANYILRAVSLSAGSHEVVFKYDTSLLRKALSISVASFAIALLVLLTSVWQAWKGRPLGSPDHSPDV